VRLSRSRSAALGPRLTLCARSLDRYYGTGAVFGKIMCIIVMVEYVLLALLDYFSPRSRIERAPKFDLERWKQVRPYLAMSRSHSRLERDTDSVHHGPRADLPRRARQ